MPSCQDYVWRTCFHITVWINMGVRIYTQIHMSTHYSLRPLLCLLDLDVSFQFNFTLIYLSRLSSLYHSHCNRTDYRTGVLIDLVTLPRVNSFLLLHSLNHDIYCRKSDNLHPHSVIEHASIIPDGNLVVVYRDKSPNACLELRNPCTHHCLFAAGNMYRRAVDHVDVGSIPGLAQ